MKTLSVVAEYGNIYAQSAADFINRRAAANGWTEENRRDFEREIESCDKWIAEKLSIVEVDCDD